MKLALVKGDIGKQNLLYKVRKRRSLVKKEQIRLCSARGSLEINSCEFVEKLHFSYDLKYG